MTTLTIDELKLIPAFEGLPEAELGWFVEHGEVRELEPDERLFGEGEPADFMTVVLSGGIRLVLSEKGQKVLDDVMRAGTVTGVLPYSRMTVFRGRGYAIGPTRVLLVHRKDFPEMLRSIPEIGERLVAIMSNRVREFSRQQQQREKMMALGQLSAGLAHELNNPAAAIRRDVAELQERLEHLSCTILEVACQNLSDEQLEAATALRQRFAKGVADAALTTVLRSEREDDVADWLDEHGVEDGYALAETFVDAGLTAEDLEEVAGALPPEALPSVLKWIETHVAAEQTLRDVLAASGRISELVAAVKSYSHMDQAMARQPVNLQDGLESTLTILAHKLKKKNVRLRRDYTPDLPLVQAMGGELNQVWTNLLDNAIDAVPDGGEITLSTRQEGSDVYVDVIDNGHGIPPEVQSRIFDPFFTTKGVGEGTGIGLDIVHRIVTQHQGTVQVASQPGRTVFSVRLPLEGAEEPSSLLAAASE